MSVPIWPTIARARRSRIGSWMRVAGEDDSEQSEDRAGCADRGNPGLAEDEAVDRSRRAAQSTYMRPKIFQP